jgi:dGTPase
MNEILEKAKQNMILKEHSLAKFACESEKGKWLKEDAEDIRPIFFRDIDRIIHSSGYARYIDKTQVYSFIQNDHITRRVLHVQLVSKIARTIGRSLKLNEDLIEAIALGHDIGHTPFGHKGESLLNDICIKENIGYFCHNAQSVRILQDIENLNISVQTLDGILAHNGEILKRRYEYNPNKTIEEFKQDLYSAFNELSYSKKIVPMTLEGCVVRLADVIAYIGRDIEDAITVNVVKREEIPEFPAKVLGDNNSKIVDTLIKDIIINSFDKPYLEFSEEVFNSLMELKDWNYEKIYNSKKANVNYDHIENITKELYRYYLNRLKYVNYEEELQKEYITSSEKTFYTFVNKMMHKEEKQDIKRIVVDYIAGQTDKFFLNECGLYLE